MRPRGQSEIDRARADGRWDRAYAGSATIEVPEYFLSALRADSRARAAFDALNRQARYSILHPLVTAPTESTRTQRLAKAIEKLLDGPGAPDAQ